MSFGIDLAVDDTGQHNDNRQINHVLKHDLHHSDVIEQHDGPECFQSDSETVVKKRCIRGQTPSATEASISSLSSMADEDVVTDGPPSDDFPNALNPHFALLDLRSDSIDTGAPSPHAPRWRDSKSPDVRSQSLTTDEDSTLDGSVTSQSSHSLSNGMLPVEFYL